MFKQAYWPRMIAAVVMTALLAVVIFQNWQLIVDSVDQMRTIPWHVIALGLLLAMLTFGFAATSYYCLSFRKLPRVELGIVELSAAFINRLVPSGLGGLGVHGLYLHRRKHTVAQATTVVSVNNLGSLVTHISMLLLVLIFVRPTSEFHLGWPVAQGWVLLGLGLVLCVILSIKTLRNRLITFGYHLIESLGHYRRNPKKVVGSALALTLLTITNTAILWLVSSAVGITLAPVAIFIVFSIGVLVGAVVPTPGGFGGVEAGLISGFLAFGVPSEQAIAAALAFRLLTYWFPLVPGGVALLYAQKRNILKFSK